MNGAAEKRLPSKWDILFLLGKKILHFIHELCRGKLCFGAAVDQIEHSGPVRGEGRD